MFCVLLGCMKACNWHPPCGCLRSLCNEVLGGCREVAPNLLSIPGIPSATGALRHHFYVVCLVSCMQLFFETEIRVQGLYNYLICLILLWFDFLCTVRPQTWIQLSEWEAWLLRCWMVLATDLGMPLSHIKPRCSYLWNGQSHSMHPAICPVD